MKAKTIFIFFSILISFCAHAEPTGLKITWFGSACVAVSDGETSILFDPFFTRPSLWDVVSFKGLHSNPKIVSRWLSKLEPAKLSAVVASHSHYDHTLDLAETVRISGAKVYGSYSTKNILLGSRVKGEFESIKVGSGFTVGDFKIKVLGGEHPPHFMNLTLASGVIESPLKMGSSAYAYKKDKDFSFLIEHPKGNVVFHPSGNSILKKSDAGGFEADLVVLGIANRSSSDDLLKKAVLPFKAQTVIPVHFDNIFTPLAQNPGDLFGVDRAGFEFSFKQVLPKGKLVFLKHGETHSL